MKKTFFLKNRLMKRLLFFVLGLIFFSSCNTTQSAEPKETPLVVQKEKDSVIKKLIVAAEDTANYMKLLRGKKIALVANPTSRAFGKHLLDFFLENSLTVEKVFAPEHGFRGSGEAGEKIQSGIDDKTGVKIVSLFGKNLKPSSEQMRGLDVVVYDIQDVGCRFFTYISTLHNVMEACAENNVKVLVLDRPNPNIDYVDGPIREDNCVSFVGLDPLPVVYGMTVGELAFMMNLEGWLKGGVKCDLQVIPVKNYTRKTKYVLPVKPSPNLPDYLSVRMYPSLCFFEATNISVGRGTLKPFSSIGYPDPKYGEYVFTPKDIPGMQTNPLHEGQKCYGLDFSGLNPDEQRFTLKYFIEMYKLSSGKMLTREKWLSLLLGNTRLKSQLDSGLSEEEIRKTWQPKLDEFKEKRKKYLIYD